MVEILKNTWKLLTLPEKRQFSILTGLDMLVSVFDIVALAALVWIVQLIVLPVSQQTEHIASTGITIQDPFALMGIFVALFAAKNIAAFYVARSYQHFAGNVAIRISKNNLASYQATSYDDYVSTDSSVHIRKIAFQPFEFCQYMLAGIQQVITQLCLVIAAIAAMLLFKPTLFLLLLLILLPPVVLLFYRLKARLSAARQQIRSNNERSFQYLLDALKAYVEGNIFNRNKFFLDRFVQFRQKFSASLFEVISLQTLPGRMIEVFAMFGLFVLMAVAKWTGNTDKDTMLTIGAFIAAAYRIIPGLVKIINATGQLRAYEPSLADLVATNAFIHNEHAAAKPRISRIEMRNIHFAYGKENVLTDFSFIVREGEMVGISGASGRGKSTIFNLLLGLVKPTSGEIRFNNHVMSGDIKSYWPFISYVKQQPFLINDSVLKNITLEEDDYQPHNLAFAVAASGLQTFIDAFPEGVNKLVTENGKNISGGQQQRIALARAFYKNADLLMLDEPFNELDPASELAIIHYLKQLAASGKMVVLITHNKSGLSLCDKIISLDNAAG
jgi:ABC-type bacteriocin/lantibiotic exporter with double-glycine peptidase domain